MAAAVKGRVKNEVERLAGLGIKPRMGAITLQGNLLAEIFFNFLKRTADELGIAFDGRVFPEAAGEEALTEAAAAFSQDPLVHGIFVESQLPKGVNSFKVFAAIDPLKDIDGATILSRGTLMRGDLDSALMPVTPLACLKILDDAGINLSGQKVCLIGRGETVGIPLLVLLVRRNATVTICHTKTPDLYHETMEADIIISAAGVPKLLMPHMLMPGQTVIDCGIAILHDGTIVGDADPRTAGVADFLTPVPGGIGTLTGALLMQNLIKAIHLQHPDLPREPPAEQGGEPQ